ncbi:50S ribosomal protein L18 [Myxococcota bacterium]|nr:50S ribosomal protein L18 [Myxococcota bacterium]MBU1411285.1 50S ribosomal protein L18 [Myxococcota bacterium]MBU1509660.1 50S ribosomal protein L18 [Myxococcota bacterium]
MISKKKLNMRRIRQLRVRKHVKGLSERPRLAVFRSNSHIYVQVIDDVTGQTLASVSTLTPDVRDGMKGLKKKEQAKKIGMKIAEICKAKNIELVTFDRAGYLYHGRVAALAEGAREGGLNF